MNASTQKRQNHKFDNRLCGESIALDFARF